MFLNFKILRDNPELQDGSFNLMLRSHKILSTVKDNHSNIDHVRKLLALQADTENIIEIVS